MKKTQQTSKKNTPKKEESNKPAAYTRNGDTFHPYTLRNLGKIRYLEDVCNLQIAAVEFVADTDNDDILILKRIILANTNVCKTIPGAKDHFY
jgi:hypothetical protein